MDYLVLIIIAGAAIAVALRFWKTIQHGGCGCSGGCSDSGSCGGPGNTPTSTCCGGHQGPPPGSDISETLPK